MLRKMLRPLMLLAMLPLASCHANRSGNDIDVDGTVDAGRRFDARPAPCMKLTCRISQCQGGFKTTLKGVVNIPNGSLPLHKATVYVPASSLGPISSGPSCNRCDAELSGNPIVHTTTDINGNFTLEGVPDGNDVPLVIQVGKWRRQAKLPQVYACIENTVDPELTRLPRNQQEGNLPKIALTTGGADALECLLRRIGIDDNEFTPEGSSGRVNLFNSIGGTDRYAPPLNGGAAFTSAETFWEKLDNLKKYDVIAHSCEGTDTLSNKSMAARQALLDYLNMGGRVFASHFHYIWIGSGAGPLPTVGMFNGSAPWPTDPVTADIDTSFERGEAFADWLLLVRASTERGKLEVRQARGSVQSLNPTLAQRWIYVTSPSSVQYLSFNTPLGEEEKRQCGRMVLTDIHVASGNSSGSSFPFPNGCRSAPSAPLSPQEKALIYMFFDLSNCLGPIIG